MLKFLFGPAALAAAVLALAGAPAQAAPAHAGAPLQTDSASNASHAIPAYHTYRHTLALQRYARQQRLAREQRRRALRYQYRWNPAPRCTWSRYYQRRICR